jgi:16S rRNA (guanine1516-N2)-methyltransferase
MDEKREELTLVRDEEGLALVGEGQMLRGDFTRMLPRIKAGRLNSELLVKAAKIKKAEGELTAVDATAGLGEDSLLLAAAGFNVTLYERNPVVYELLKDALERAAQIPELAPVVARMTAVHADSVAGMASLETPPDVILLDPMFPARQKSALVKKKLQMIQKLEQPCDDEITLLLTAMEAKPKKLIVKRPPKGDYLAGLKPDHSIEGKAVRFDCFASPYDRLEKFKEKLK